MEIAFSSPYSFRFEPTDTIWRVARRGGTGQGKTNERGPPLEYVPVARRCDLIVGMYASSEAPLSR